MAAREDVASSMVLPILPASITQDHVQRKQKGLELPKTPLLEDLVHSGIPRHLQATADTIKSTILARRDASPKQRTLVLPPDTNRDQFDTAMRELESIVGKDNVKLNDGPLEDGWYLEHPNTHDAHPIADPEYTVSSAAVYPGSVEEVCAVIKWANQSLIPLWPISMGRNFGYGGAGPRVPGSVVVDLGRRMNKILSIDEETCSCLVEPGVSYFALYEEVRKRGYKLMVDVPELGGGSVMGNALDRGMGYSPLGDHWGNHCGLELVTPEGTVVRTGMGALPGEGGADNPCWTSFPHSYGPSVDGLFSQSNLGIVTKMGIWLMPETRVETVIFTFDKDDDVFTVLPVIQKLVVGGALASIPLIGGPIQDLVCAFTQKQDVLPDENLEVSISSEKIRKYMDKHSPLGSYSWIVYAGLYGPPQATDQQCDTLKAQLLTIPGSKFFLREQLPESHYVHDRHHVFSGIPGLRDLAWYNWLPNCAHLAFSPILPIGREHLKKVWTIVDKKFKQYGFDPMFGIFPSPRETHFICVILYDSSKEHRRRAAHTMMHELIDEVAKAGYGEYRTHILLADHVAKSYGFNNNALLRLQETIKDALDPNGILAPGRCGIWPKRFRNKGWELMGNEASNCS